MQYAVKHFMCYTVVSVKESLKIKLNEVFSGFVNHKICTAL